MSAQVISEFINVTRRQIALSKADILIYCSDLLRDCECIPVSWETLNKAASLIQKYNFQIFDAIILAAALEGNCTLLYSEDMQHGLKIDSLTIINPFWAT
nr:PIN domain-containing protein [Flavipsychrobacter stenotrophus]